MIARVRERPADRGPSGAGSGILGEVIRTVGQRIIGYVPGRGRIEEVHGGLLLVGLLGNVGRQRSLRTAQVVLGKVGGQIAPERRRVVRVAKPVVRHVAERAARATRLAADEEHPVAKRGHPVRIGIAALAKVAVAVGVAVRLQRVWNDRAYVHDVLDPIVIGVWDRLRLARRRKPRSGSPHTTARAPACLGSSLLGGLCHNPPARADAQPLAKRSAPSTSSPRAAPGPTPSAGTEVPEIGARWVRNTRKSAGAFARCSWFMRIPLASRSW